MPDTIIRDDVAEHQSTSRKKRCAQTFNPTALVEAVIAAVLPFVNEKGDDLKDDVSKADVVQALVPLFGHFTVYDAVLVRFMLDPASNIDVVGLDVANPKQHAIWAAREAIVDFVAHARASSPECAAARIYMAEDEEDMHAVHDAHVLKAMGGDVACVRTGQYRGQLFGATDRIQDGWFPWSMMETQEQAAD